MTIIFYLIISWLTWDWYWIVTHASAGGSEGFGFRLLVLSLGAAPIAIDLSYLFRASKLFWYSWTGK